MESGTQRSLIRIRDALRKMESYVLDSLELRQEFWESFLPATTYFLDGFLHQAEYEDREGYRVSVATRCAD